MILESLHNHYCEQVDQGNPLYSPQGMELKRVHFIIGITLDGLLVSIEEREGMTNVVRSRHRSGKEASQKPNYMWDSLGYITGEGGCQVHHAAFKEMVRQVEASYTENRTFKAVSNFYRRGVEQLFADPLWRVVSSKKGHNLTFRLLGEELTAAQQRELVKPVSRGVALLHPKLYISGAAGTGAKLVSYGTNLGYESYNLKGGHNASISTDVAQGYASAITALRQRGDQGNIVIGDVTFLCFDDTIIGLVPNASRISVRLFLKGYNVERLGDKELLSWLIALAPYGDLKRLSSQFIIDFVEAEITGKQLPTPTLQLLMKGDKFHTSKITLLHKYLNIKDMSLNTQSSNTGYLLGRMLAIVERAQTVSQPGLTYTIKDQAYATLSVTPAAFFNRLFSLSTNYFRRIPKIGTQIYLKMLLSEVTDKLSVEGIPMRLSLEDQGRFALGYQHQNQSFFVKSSDDK